MKRQIIHVSVLQTSKVLALLYAVMGLLFVPFGLFVLLTGRLEDAVVILALPLFYGVGSFFFLLIACAAYNIIARKFGGIEYTSKSPNGR